jgi:hypothetical protein
LKGTDKAVNTDIYLQKDGETLKILAVKFETTSIP